MDIDNENIIRCHEVFEDAACVHFVLEIIYGGDLFDYIINSPGHRIDQEKAVNFFQTIADSLHYLHSNKIVHRDLKPENFLVYEENNTIKIKLIDFGFATRFTDEDPELYDRVGSIQYIAPEVFYEENSYNYKVDVWAAGVVFFNMLSGKQPFDGVDDLDLMEKIKYDPPNFNYPVFESVDANIITILEKVLEKNPIERLTAFEIKENLKVTRNCRQEDETVMKQFKPSSETVKNIKELMNFNSNLKSELWAMCLMFLPSNIVQKIEVYLVNF